MSNRNRLVGILLPLIALALGPGAVRSQDLGSGELLIAGTRLVVSPAEQTVPFETPTLIETSLEGYDVGLGILPPNLRVVGEFTGPEINGVLRLETQPNEPFRIPRLRLKGTYILQDIRLEQDGELLAYAEPREATVQVTRILVTSVSAQAMTEDEMRSYGVVVGDGSYQAFNLTFGFGLRNGELTHYTLPVVYRLYGTDAEDGFAEPQLSIPAFESDSRTTTSRFVAPRLAPFKIDLEPEVREQVQVPKGGCDFKQTPCRKDDPPAPPMVGVIMFPTDVSLLHQFFSVVLMVQNGAPEGDALTVRDLTAKARLPSGLRAAETEPPTPLGVPVPVRAPGPDGEVGTSDDLRLLVAQATGEAEFLVEGLREGSHIVEFDMQGVLEGMPGGPRPITGKAKGAVLVRDPTLAVSLAHPEVVRAHEPYSLFVTLSNLGNAPVNGIDFNLRASGLAGVQLAEGQGPTESVGSLLPGEAATVEFALVPQLTGRVIASSAKSGSALQPSFDFDVGISNGVPLSPLSLAMPKIIDELPAAFRTEAIGLLGLGHSLSTATPGVAPEAPRVTRQTIHERVYQLVQAARHLALGDNEFDALSVLAAEWLGSRDETWEWDRMRRSTDRGLAVTVELAEVFAQKSTVEAFERIATLTSYLDPQLVAAYGAGVRLEMQSRTSGKQSDDGAAARELPFVDLYPLDDGVVAMATTPEEGGYRAIVRRDHGGSFGLKVLLPAFDNGAMKVLSWSSVTLGAGAEAWVDFDAVEESLVLEIDDDGDGTADRSLPALTSTLLPRPFEVISAIQNHVIDPSGHVIEVLFSSEVDLESIVPRDAARFTIPGKVSNGGITPVEQDIGSNASGQIYIDNPFEGLFNPRVVRVVFDNPISPLVDPSENLLTVSDIQDVLGRRLVGQTVPVILTVDQPGIRVEGQVIDPYGQPLPYAEVGLWQWDRSGIEGLTVECRKHRTAAVRADGEGRFEFDYVRETDCSARFELKAASSVGPHQGTAVGKVRLVGSTQELDVVMVGRGIVSGRVLYDDGTVPSGLQVFAHNPVFDAGRRAWVDDAGNYRMAEVAVGTVTLWAQDDRGNRVFQTIEVPTAGAEVKRDLVMLRRPDAATARLSGRATDFATGEPELNAYIALYVDGARVNVARTDADGLFDFGVVPTGVAEVEAFDGTTGRRGTQFFFELDPDEVEYIELQLRDDRGTVEGFVRHRLVDGTVVPVAGAVVWAEGTPFNTITDDQGYYALEDVFPGRRRIKAANLEANEVIEVFATVSAGVTQSADLYFEDEFEVQGGLYGTVRDADGEVVEGATIHLAGGYLSTNWHHEARTDEDGRFYIANLEPGVYGVHAMKGTRGGITFAEIRFPGDSDDVTVRLLSGKIRGRTFVRDDQGYVQGVKSTITYRHVEVVQQWGVVAVAPDFSYTETDGDGYFEIDALHGPYEIYAYNPFQDTGYRKVKGSLGPIGPNHQIEFKQNGSISGVVWLEDGETPAVGATVKLRGGAFNDYDLETDEEGRFTFELVPPGRYRVTAVLDQGVLFREERVYAEMRRHGAEMDIEIRLQAQGRVEGSVVDADGAFVPGAVVELRERGYPWRRIVHNADADGQYSFDNIFEGEVTLRAKAPELGGLAGHECAEISFEGELVNVEIQLEGTGDLRGQVIHPGTGAGVPNARVALYRDGGPFIDSTNTDSDGFFEIRAIKLRSYHLRVFDPSTGRRGRSGTFAIDQHGQEVEQDVVLEVRGVVQGHLYDPDAGNQGVPGATLQLHSRGIRWFKTYSSTGIDGEYSFEGIPEGDFNVTTYGERRRASGEGRIEEEDQVFELDLYLERQSRLFGRILGPRRFEGDPGELFENVNTTVYEYGGLAGATTDNPFDFDGLLPRHPMTLVAREINGSHQAKYEFRLDRGEDREKDIRMRAIGSARIHALSSTGEPVPGVQVRVKNSYTLRSGAASNDRHGLSHKIFEASTGEDNEVIFPGIRQGFVEARIEDPLTGLKGRKVRLLEWDGEELLVEVRLQQNGWVRGQVLLSDGVTPAAFAIVALDAPGRSWQLEEADEEGRFEFEAVPLGDYILIAQQVDGPGTYELRSNLAVDQEIDDHTLVLDDEDPYVLSVDPPFGSRDTARDLDVVVTFSEPIRSCGSCNQVYLQRISTSEKPSVQRIWSEDRTVLTLRPTLPLRNHTGYKLVVGTSLADMARRNLAWRVVSSFYTEDTVPPKVIDVRPKNGAVQVPVASSLEVTFSEPVALDSLSGAFQVIDTTASQTLTVTTLTALDDRRVILTPVGDFSTDRLIEVRVQGPADASGNVMTTPFVWSFWTPDATPPEIEWTSPAEGQVFTAGEKIQVSAEITDNRGVGEVVYSLGDWTRVLTSPPFTWQIPAPVVEEAGPVPISVHVTDIFGNVAVDTREVFVEPLDNASPPGLAVGCPVDGDLVAPGVAQPVTFSVHDDMAVESAWLLIDGLRVDRETPVDDSTADIELSWTPPEDAVPGQVFQASLETRDFAGNITSVPLVFAVPESELLIGDQELPESGAVALAAGHFTLAQSVGTGELTLLHGATLTATDGAALQAAGLRQQCGSVARLDRTEVSGAVTVERGAVLGPRRLRTLSLQAAEVTIEEGAEVDGRKQGYHGQHSGTPWTPAGRAKPSVGDGAAHGGYGVTRFGNSAVAPGESFDSVYVPTMHGAGGAESATTHEVAGGDGGGVVIIEATGTLRLNGTVDVRGADGRGSPRSGAGAGGTVRLLAQRLEGAGSVLASGGDNTCGVGGGGRVAIHAPELSFDPASQVTNQGGIDACDNGSSGSVVAGPGTTLVETAGSVYGTLLVAGGDWPAEVKEAGHASLTPLGELDVVATQIQGPDLWLFTSAQHLEAWLGAFASLRDPVGQELGTFRVLEVDQDRLLLGGASGVSGDIASVGGVYRFDRLEVRNAYLLADDPVQVDHVTAAGRVLVNSDFEAASFIVAPSAEVLLRGTLTAHTLDIGEGASLTPDKRPDLRLEVAGLMTVGEGAVLAANGRGHRPGDPDSGLRGYAPSGVLGSRDGGSHGGLGHSGNDPGEVYGSVYAPSYSGGGGGSYTTQHGALKSGGHGGGRVEISAGELVLDGTVRANGYTGGSGDRGGAGGTVVIATAQLSGSGLLEARGAGAPASGGGGGRIALYADEISGFDPATQASVRGGEAGSGSFASLLARGGAGTVFVRTQDSIYGDLYVDARETSGLPVGLTPLPVLGSWTIASVEADAHHPADAWVEPTAAGAVFDLGVEGMWARVGGAEYRVLAEAGDRRRILLEGASGALAAGQTLSGLYRFDVLTVAGGARLEIADALDAGQVISTDGWLGVPEIELGRLDVPVGAVFEVDAAIHAEEVVVAGTLRGESGLSLLAIDADRVVVESGGSIDQSGRGHGHGVDSTGLRGKAPTEVQGSMWGGSHGGFGHGGADHGETFGSVYRPHFSGGGGGSFYVPLNTGLFYGGRGGGVIEIRATEAVVDGEIRADGNSGHGERGGAGGSVLLEVDRLLGAGGIYARGADGDHSGGGGGRVALLAGELLGFDPEAQTSVVGGEGEGSFPGVGAGRGGSGTVYVHSLTSTYGELHIDAGTATDVSVGDTALPSFGNWTVGVAEFDGANPADLWIEPQDPDTRVDLGVEGMWARVSGLDYRVLAESGDRRRVLLAGAAASVSVGDTVEGVYKFDRVTLRGPARVLGADEVEAATVETYDQAVLDTPLDLATLTVATGAVLVAKQPVRADVLTIQGGAQVRAVRGVPTVLDVGQLIVEPGGLINADGMGYLGSAGGDRERGHAPDGISGSLGGGAHAGDGEGSGDKSYGSAYRPRFGGAGGAAVIRQLNSDLKGGDGGGVIDIFADSVQLDGVIRANGQPGYHAERGGAGGSIHVEAGALAGSGSLQARGAEAEEDGGGGRIALLVDSLSIDVDQQVFADSVGVGGAGTVFVRRADSTWGDLYVDARADGATVGWTRLSRIEENEVANVEIDAENSDDLWVDIVDSGADPSLGVEGMWALIQGAEYRVLAEAERGRFLLEGAAGLVQAGAVIEGFYRFDNVFLRNGGRLSSRDAIDAGAWHVDSGTELTVGELGPGHANCGSGNLLLNPGGDEPEVSGPDGRIPHWIQVSGDWTDGDPGWSAGYPQDGPDYLWPGEVSSGELYQDIDLMPWSAEIDHGLGRGFFAGSLLSPGNDPARFIVEYRNEAGEVVETFDTGERLADFWSRETDYRQLPMGIRSARVRLIARRVPPFSHLSAAFDAMRFHLLPAPSLALTGDTAIAETAGQATYQLTLACERPLPVAVSYQTATVTSQEGADYAPVSGVLTFEPGETAKTLAVDIHDDSLAEGNERFELQAASGDVELLTPVLTTVIVDDELGGLTVELADIFTGDGLYPGAEVGYSASVSYSGAGLANARIIGQLDGELSIVPASVSTSAGTVTSTTPLTVDLGDLVSGSEITITFTARLDSYPTAGAAAAQLALAADGIQDVLSDDPATVEMGDATLTPISPAPANVELSVADTVEGRQVTLTGTFTDPTAGDTFTATVDWGDGSGPENVDLTAEAAGGSFSVAHVYADNGSYPAQICVTDAAGGEACGITQIDVENAEPQLGLIDLQNWTVETFASTNLSPPSWNFSTDGTRVHQTANNEASVVYSDFPAHGPRIKGQMRFESDDDYVGYVVGFEPGDTSNPDADYLLVTWKGKSEGNNPLGLRVYRIRGVPTNFWRLDLDGAAELLATASTLGGSKWTENKNYRVEIESTANHFRLWINDGLELDVAAPVGDSLPSGRVGFYCHSQSSAKFHEWSFEAATSPADHAVAPFRQMWKFDDWTAENVSSNTSLPPCAWEVSSEGRVVKQFENCRTGVFLSPTDLRFTRITGVWTFLGDDDRAGMVFGYRPGDAGDPDADYLVLSWRKVASGNSPRGLHLYRIRGQFAGFSGANVELLAEGLTLSDVGWTKDRRYRWTVRYEPQRFRLWIDGELELDFDAGSDPFRDGRFGLMASAQEGLMFYHLERYGLDLTEGETSPPIVAGFGDSGVLDSHTATVDWGDGTTPAAANVTQGAGFGHISAAARTFSDNLLLGGEVCLTDDDAGVRCSELPIRVANVAPAVDAGDPLAGDVGSDVALSAATFTDPGTADTHTATVDWGDGAMEAVTVGQGAGSGTLDAAHAYADPGTYAVTICVADDDGGMSCDGVTATIASTLALQASVGAAQEGEAAFLSGSYGGAGAVQSLTVDWGDGTAIEDGTYDAVIGSISGQHTYVDEGDYLVRVCLLETGDIETCVETTAAIVNAAPVVDAG
ncbi:MAG: carboxypeptidase regulatory-like domain-containing protein, partial [Thermoanaerobaculia bacterium]|nr:carboxypeptidase regulatory-like domain-containing protein [Thermoanaerobaculia bacterium]